MEGMLLLMLNQGGHGGTNYPHPPGGGAPRGDGPGNNGHPPGGSGVGNPSYHTNRGGFGNIHSNGKLIWSAFFRIVTSYLDFWFKQLDISGP